MKIRERAYVQKEIGFLDAHMILPMAGRIRANMKTICESCGEHIKDEKFIGGFKHGRHNMLFHLDCVPEEDRGKLVI